MAKRTNRAAWGLVVPSEKLLWRFFLLALVILAAWMYLRWALVVSHRKYDYRYKLYIQSEYIPWVMTRDKRWPTSLDQVEQHLRERSVPDHPFVLWSHRHSKPELRVLRSDASTFEGELQFRWGSGESYKVSASKPAAETGFEPASPGAVRVQHGANQRDHSAPGRHWFSAVPTGLDEPGPCSPGMNAWANIGCPSGTRTAGPSDPPLTRTGCDAP